MICTYINIYIYNPQASMQGVITYVQNVQIQKNRVKNSHFHPTVVKSKLLPYRVLSSTNSTS